jgi:glutamyl-tRNA(Gln) amidotransferase subunit E
MLKERGVKEEDLEHTYIDLTDIFDSKSIPSDYIIMGIRVPKFGGLFGLEIQPGKDFGQDIIEKTELISGVPRFYQFHSDEMNPKSFRKMRYEQLKDKSSVQENYFFKHITTKLDKTLRKELNLKKDDAYFLALGPQKWVIHAMKKILERSKMALHGVPQETRRFLPDCNTEFLRVIHGKDRLYPDTDTPPIDMDVEIIKKLKERVRKRPWEIVEEFKKYKLNYSQVVKLIRHNRVEFFRNLVEEFKFNPTRCYQFLEETLVALRRKGLKVKKIKSDLIIEILKGAHDGLYDFNQIPAVTEEFIKKPKKKLMQVLSDLKFKKVTQKDLERYYTEALKDIQDSYWKKAGKKKRASKITGIIMQRIKGAYSGKKVYDFVLSKIGK